MGQYKPGIKFLATNTGFFNGTTIPISNKMYYKRTNNAGGYLNTRDIMKANGLDPGNYTTAAIFGSVAFSATISPTATDEQVFNLMRAHGLRIEPKIPINAPYDLISIPAKGENSAQYYFDFRFLTDKTSSDSIYSGYSLFAFPFWNNNNLIGQGWGSPYFTIGGTYSDREVIGITYFSFTKLYDDEGEWGLFWNCATQTFFNGAHNSYTFTNNPSGYFNVKFIENTYHVDFGINLKDDAADPNNQVPWGNSEPDGGEGDFDFSSDQINPVDITTNEFTNFIATAAGFVTLYQPSAAQLQMVAKDLYNLFGGGGSISDIIDNAIYGNIDKIIVGLGILPVRPLTSGYKTPMVGNNELTPMQVVSSQYYELDCGSLEIAECYGSYLDYNPYTKISIYLPYIGVKELNVDEIMAGTISVKYFVDCYNGNCVANIMVQKEGIPLSVRYCFSGNCMQEIPVNSENWNQVMSNCVALATTVVGGAVAGAGIAAAGAAGAASAANAGNAAMASSGANAGFAANAAKIQGGANMARTTVNLAQNANKTAGAAVGNVIASKMMPERAGALGQSIGMMSPQTPYIIRTIPKISLPENYAHHKGYPSNIYAPTLGSLEGYTEVESVILNNLAATEPETEEIYKLLQEGIYI